MFMTSFPPLTRNFDEFNEENVEEYLLNARKVVSRFVEDGQRNTVTKSLAGVHGGGWW